MSTRFKIWRESAGLILAAKSVFSPSSYKILCMKRASKSPFFPGTYAFPGGALAKIDTSLEWFKLYEKFGFNKQSFDKLRANYQPSILRNNQEDVMPKYLSFRICAIRETFEECGILLCRSPKITTDTDSSWAAFVAGHELRSWQEKVNKDPSNFLTLCQKFEIVPDVWGLHSWSNWKTPAMLTTLKFNTVFFLATVDQMPTAYKDEREVQDLMWTTPNECIKMSHQQSVLLPVPQFYEISRLRKLRDLEKLSVFAKERGTLGMETYWPCIVKTDKETHVLFPGDELYPKDMDENWEKAPYFEKLPDSQIKNRLFQSSEFLYKLCTENVEAEFNHVIPNSDDQ